MTEHNVEPQFKSRAQELADSFKQSGLATNSQDSETGVEPLDQFAEQSILDLNQDSGSELASNIEAADGESLLDALQKYKDSADHIQDAPAPIDLSGSIEDNGDANLSKEQDSSRDVNIETHEDLEEMDYADFWKSQGIEANLLTENFFDYLFQENLKLPDGVALDNVAEDASVYLCGLINPLLVQIEQSLDLNLFRVIDSVRFNLQPGYKRCDLLESFIANDCLPQLDYQQAILEASKRYHLFVKAQRTEIYNKLCDYIYALQRFREQCFALFAILEQEHLLLNPIDSIFKDLKQVYAFEWLFDFTLY